MGYICDKLIGRWLAIVKNVQFVYYVGMMKLCKTCKWWREVEYLIDNGISNPRDPDTYELMEMPFTVKACESPKLLFYERPVESTGACVVDGSEYMAALITAEDFCCVNHEAE